MARAKKKSARKTARKTVIPAHPAVPPGKEIAAMCAEIYRFAVKSARQAGLDEQSVEQAALGEIKSLMTACIKQSKDDWNAYTKATGVHAAYVQVKQSAKGKTAARASKAK